MKHFLILLIITSVFPVTVAKVEFLRHDVFPAEEGFEHFPFPLLNFLHIDTREFVLRRLVPFSEGDEIDGEELLDYIQQGERNLKNNEIISNARVFSVDTIESGLFIIYETWEMWTTKPTVDVSYVADELEYSAELEEANILGLGCGVEVVFGKEIDDYHRKLKVDIPAILPGRTTLALLLDDSPRRDSYKISVKRPLISNHDRLLTGFRYRQERGYYDHWIDGDIIEGEYFKEEFFSSIDFSYRVGNDFFIESSFNYLDKKSEFRDDKDRHRGRRIALGLRHFRREYRTTRPIDAFNRDYEISTGHNLSMALDIDPFADDDKVKLDCKALAVLPAGDFYLNLLASSSWSFYKRSNVLQFTVTSPLFLNSRLVHSYDYRQIQNGDIDDYLFQGSDNRLRGYLIHEFVGNQYFCSSLEYRFFPQIEVWSIRPSFTAYIDMGNFDSFDSFDDYHFGGGGGVRIMSTKASTLMRFEIATPLGLGKPCPEFIIVSDLPYDGIISICDFIGNL